MHFIHTVVRFFPYWAFPVGLIVAELAWYFRRKKSPMEYYCWGISGFLFIGIVAWIAARGDLHSDQWVKYFFGG